MLRTSLEISFYADHNGTILKNVTEIKSHFKDIIGKLFYADHNGTILSFKSHSHTECNALVQCSIATLYQVYSQWPIIIVVHWPIVGSALQPIISEI